jgi:hypothetical protein
LVFIGAGDEILQEFPEALSGQDKVFYKDGGQAAECPAATPALVPVGTKDTVTALDSFSAAVLVIAVQEPMEDKKTRPPAMRAGVLLEGSLETLKLGRRAVKSGDHGRPKYKTPAWSLPNYRRSIKLSLRYYFGKISLL